MRIRFFAIIIMAALAGGSICAQEKLNYPRLLTALNATLPKGVTKAKLIEKLIADVQRQGVDKPLTVDREDDLRQAGATDDLIDAIRANSPPLAKPSPELPKPTPQDQSIDEDNFRVYRDPDGIFSIAIYSSWKVQRQVKTSSNGNISIQTLFASADAERAELGGYLSSGMIIDIVLPPPGGSFNPEKVATDINQTAEAILRQNKGFEITNSGLFIIDDMSAKVYRYQGKGPLVSESEKDIVYIFGNQKAVVVINLVEPNTKAKLLDITNERCAKSFVLNPTFAVPSAPVGPSPAAVGVSLKTLESNFKSGLYDDAIRVGVPFLQANPNSAEANAYVGLSYLAKNNVEDAVDLLEKSIGLGHQISLPVKRLREPLFGHNLENAMVILSPNGVAVSQGNSYVTAAYGQLAKSFLTNYKNQCSVATLQGLFTETKAGSNKSKTENRTFNMFPPNSALVAVPQGQYSVNNAVCDLQNLNTTLIIKLIARLSARVP